MKDKTREENKNEDQKAHKYNLSARIIFYIVFRNADKRRGKNEKNSYIYFNDTVANRQVLPRQSEKHLS